MNTIPESTKKFSSGCRFDLFTIQDSNRDAYETCRAFAVGAGSSSLLTIEGEISAGKTHLLFAMGHPDAHRDNVQVLGISGERLCAWVVEQVRGDTTTGIVPSEEADHTLLLIDDAHFLEKREATQHEVARQITAWIGQGTRVALTCPDFERCLPVLCDTLRQAGVSVQSCRIDRPSPEEMETILRHYPAWRDWRVPDRVYDEAVSTADGSMRRAIGHVIRFVAYESLMKDKESGERSD